MLDIKYVASPTGAAFHADQSRFKGIWGPIGSGKTVTCLLEVLKRACEQEPNAQGVRDTRTAVIRQSYPQLVSTVIRSFDEWIGPLGTMTFSTPISWKARFKLADNTTVKMEVVFLALERPEDAAKLRSLELTHAMVSEAAEIPEEIVQMLRGRVGRYPAIKNGVAATRPSIWVESNPPSVRSHWYTLFEVVRPEGFKLFRQPPPLIYDHDGDAYKPNPAAENVQYLPGGYDYYLNQIAGASREYINVYILGEYGVSQSGHRIYPEFSEKDHMAPEVLRPVSKTQLVMGMDLGLNAAAVVTQLSPVGALLTLGEAVGSDMMLDQYLDEHLMPLLRTEFRGWPVLAVVDPSGNEGRAAYTLLRQYKLAVEASVTNDPKLRWDAVKWFLNRRGGFVLSPACPLLREGFLGAYHFKKVIGSSAVKHSDRAEKGPASHPHDALQYAAVYHRKEAVRSFDKKPPGTKKQFLWA